jgi:hypothetical protein
MSLRVDLMSGSVIVAVVFGLLAAVYLLIQTFVGSIGWSRLVARTSDETHSQICGDDAGKASARPAHGRDCPALRNIGTRRGISRHNAPSHQLINAEGRCCICVPIMQNGKVVDSQGFMFDLEDE